MTELASPTGQWPEAVHPFTGGGCMGDGQHGWAAAEWVMIIRHLFLREEGEGLIIGSGLFKDWLNQDGELAFGPSPTPFGDLEVRIEKTAEALYLTLNGELKKSPLFMEAKIPGTRPLAIKETNRPYKLDHLDNESNF
jgi:hypothetical protein